MKATLHIQNLKCGGCKATIIKNLTEVKNISEVEVNIDNESVTFEYYSHRDFENAKHRLSLIGYPISGTGNIIFTKTK